MEVIKVRVRDENNVNWWQVGKSDTRISQSLENEQPVGKVGIDDDVLPAELNKKTGVANESDSHFSICD